MVRKHTRDDLARNVWQQISNLFISHQTERELVASELGLTGTDLITLFHLQPDGAVSQRDLAQHWACDPSWITARIDRLEQLGFVERRPGQTDRRIKTVSLTPAGEKVRAAGMEGFARPPEILLELSTDELRAVASALGHLSISTPDATTRRRPSRV
jgi:DNA-binding MarR family transcriptional regulator